jgi:hypothetical protein
LTGCANKKNPWEGAVVRAVSLGNTGKFAFAREQKTVKTAKTVRIVAGATIALWVLCYC